MSQVCIPTCILHACIQGHEPILYCDLVLVLICVAIASFWIRPCNAGARRQHQLAMKGPVSALCPAKQTVAAPFTVLDLNSW